jgi:hypothetical protein
MEHFSLEIGARSPQTRVDSKVAPLAFLRGEDVRLMCPVNECSQVSSTLLRLVDHLNLSHPGQRLERIGALAEVKMCPCSNHYVDSSLGRAYHMRWCHELSRAISEQKLLAHANVSWLPDTHASIEMICCTDVTLVNGGDRVNLPGRHLVAQDFGSTASHDYNVCFYLCCAAPDRPVHMIDGKFVHSLSTKALTLKRQLTPCANQLSGLRLGDGRVDFTKDGISADVEVVVEYSKSKGPIAIVDTNVPLPLLLIYAAKNCRQTAPVKVLLRIREHYKRLYSSDGKAITLGLLTALRPAVSHVTPLPSPCPIETEVLNWCHKFASTWHGVSASTAPLGSNSIADPSDKAPAGRPRNVPLDARLLQLAKSITERRNGVLGLTTIVQGTPQWLDCKLARITGTTAKAVRIHGTGLVLCFFYYSYVHAYIHT